MDNSNISEREKRCVDDKYNRGAKYLDDLELNEALHFCYRWLNLPNMADVIREVDNILDENKIKQVKVRRVKEKKKPYKEVKVRRIS